MFVIANFLAAVARILDIALTLFMWIIIARAVISWVNPDPYNAIVRFLISVTEPVLSPIRRRMPFSLGGIDFSPILAFTVLNVFQGTAAALPCEYDEKTGEVRMPNKRGGKKADVKAKTEDVKVTRK